jgi:hypothetical protein
MYRSAPGLISDILTHMRSGKIMRRILRKIVSGDSDLGETHQGRGESKGG